MPPTRKRRSLHRRRHGNGHPRSRREQRDISLQRAKQGVGRAERKEASDE
ncbi:MAG: hypothetical protein IH822_12050 [Chloroflexi bacterium]|nr:hypothetical protein [Chloroflexota bacterium]